MSARRASTMQEHESTKERDIRNTLNIHIGIIFVKWIFPF